MKERPFELGNNVLLYYNNKNHVLKIYVPKQKSEDAFFGTIKHDSNKSLIKAKSLINNDSMLILLEDYYIIKSIDINSLRDKKLNFFIKIQKVENKKNKYDILNLHCYLSNSNNFKKTYFN